MLMVGIARLGQDAETRYTANGDPVVNMSLAFAYGRKDERGKRPTTWVRGAMFGERAEKLAQWLTKGQQVFVQLSDVNVRTYDKSDGGTGVSLEAKVNHIDFVGKREDDGAADTAPKAESAKAKPAQQSMADMADDIPF